MIRKDFTQIFLTLNTNLEIWLKSTEHPLPTYMLYEGKLNQEQPTTNKICRWGILTGTLNRKIGAWSLNYFSTKHMYFKVKDELVMVKGRQKMFLKKNIQSVMLLQPWLLTYKNSQCKSSINAWSVNG